MSYKVRFEISFRNFDELEEKINFCIKNKIKKINIPCKGILKKNFLLEIIEYIGKNYKDLEVIYHYSLFHQYSRNREISYENFLNFVEKAIYFKNNEILIISGSRKKNNFEVLNLLDNLNKDRFNKLKLGVAFNPYYEEINQIKLERQRLIKKLDSGLISSIWLQFGSDHNRLLEEIIYLNKYLSNYKNIWGNKPNIFGSMLIPSKQFQARFKFRPWRGVFLSNAYLNNIDVAENLTQKILEIYLKNNIQPLVETDCYSVNRFQKACKFLNLL